MPTFSIYLPHKDADEIKRTAMKRGLTPVRLLRNRLRAAVKTEQYIRLEMRLEAIILLLELLIPEIAYTGGANRAASANLNSAVQKGTETEKLIRQTAALIRARLERKAGEVVL